MDKFFVISHTEGKSAYFQFVWGNIDSYGASYIKNQAEIKNKFLKFLFRIHNSRDINRYLNLPFKNIWKKFYSLKPEMLSPSDRNFLIFDNTIKYSHSYLKYLKEHYNCVIVNILQDTLKVYKCGRNKKELDRYINQACVDKFFSFDFKDCKDFNLEYYMLYSYFPSNLTKGKAGKVCYVGSNKSKNRLNLFHSVFKKIHQEVETDFNMVGVSESNQIFPREITYNHTLKYNEVIEKIQKSDCLLDIVNDNQTGITLRCCEAICYNKKLLTNNPFIKELSFYNPEYIKIFNNANDIDIEWLKSDIDVDYHYNGDFHPTKLFEILSQTFK